MGYFLRARLAFTANPVEEIGKVQRIVSRHYEFVEGDSWMGLPELTNASGSFCRDSCRTQAWSVATLLDALYDMDCLVRRL